MRCAAWLPRPQAVFLTGSEGQVHIPPTPPAKTCFIFNKMWVWVQQYLVKKEESLPVVKLYLLTLDNFAVVSFSGVSLFFPPWETGFDQTVVHAELCPTNPKAGKQRCSHYHSRLWSARHTSALHSECASELGQLEAHFKKGTLITHHNDCICCLRVFIGNKT